MCSWSEVNGERLLDSWLRYRCRETKACLHILEKSMLMYASRFQLSERSNLKLTNFFLQDMNCSVGNALLEWMVPKLIFREKYDNRVKRCHWAKSVFEINVLFFVLVYKHTRNEHLTGMCISFYTLTAYCKYWILSVYIKQKCI